MSDFSFDADISEDFAPLIVAAGHDVLMTGQVGRSRSGDEEQLAEAASPGRIFVRYNRDHFLLPRRAWRYWVDAWSVQPRPLHAGILAIPHPQPPHLPLERLAREIDAFVRSADPLENRCSEWESARGWIGKR